MRAGTSPDLWGRTVTATEVAPSSVARRRGDRLAGLRPMVRFLLRRDQVKLPAWAGGIGLFAVYVSAAIPSVYGDDLDQLTGLLTDPVGRLLTGPGYGFGEPTVDRLVGGGYGLYFLVASALMSILLVTRHTRVEEQSGRAELLRSGPIGRHTILAAALVVALLTNVASGAAVGLALVGVGGFEPLGSALLGAAVAVVGLAFAGVTAITVQLSEHSRTGAGLAGGALGVAFVLRSGGDLAGEGGSLLSWLSPLGWGQQTAPYVLDRWWPLALVLALAVLTSAGGFVLSTRRDLGGGLFPVRLGPAAGRPWMGTPAGFGFRLQRAGILAWSASLVVAGVVFGLFADAMSDAIGDMPQVFLDLFGREDVLAGYFGVMALLMALLVAAYGIIAVQGLRTEETEGRLEPLLATPLSRRSWLGANLAVIVATAVVMSLAVGLATGAGAAAATGEASYLWQLTVAQLNFVPPVLVVVGVAAALFGGAPRALPIAWVLVIYGLLAATVAVLLDLPATVQDLDPFGHIPQMPLEAFALAPVALLTIVGLALLGASSALFSQREIDSR